MVPESLRNFAPPMPRRRTVAPSARPRKLCTAAQLCAVASAAAGTQLMLMRWQLQRQHSTPSLHAGRRSLTGSRRHGRQQRRRGRVRHGAAEEARRRRRGRRYGPRPAVPASASIRTRQLHHSAPADHAQGIKWVFAVLQAKQTPSGPGALLAGRHAQLAVATRMSSPR